MCRGLIRSRWAFVLGQTLGKPPHLGWNQAGNTWVSNESAECQGTVSSSTPYVPSVSLHLQGIGGTLRRGGGS